MSIIVGFALDIVRGAREWVDSTKPTGDDVPKSRLDTSRGQK